MGLRTMDTWCGELWFPSCTTQQISPTSTNALSSIPDTATTEDSQLLWRRPLPLEAYQTDLVTKRMMIRRWNVVLIVRKSMEADAVIWSQ